MAKELDEQKIKQAEKMYATVCDMLDDLNVNYDREDENYTVRCTIRGDDIPMDILIRVRPERQLVQLHSPMPFRAPEEKRVDLAIAISVANYGLIDGSFDYDISDGFIIFRQTASYIESILGKELFKYMLMVSASTIDEYNDKFMMLSKGMLSLEQFIEGER